MKNDIMTHLNNPVELETMYRSNKAAFKREFNNVYPVLQGNPIADVWYQRLNYTDSIETNWGTSADLGFAIAASLIAGLIAKLPDIFSINKELFYPRNIGFIVFPLLMVFFGWKNKLSVGKVAFIGGATLVGLIFINLFPQDNKSDTLVLSCIHVVLFLWSVLGFAYAGEARNNEERRLGFLKYNGDLVVMTTLILIAGAIMTGVTIGLFSLIGLNIEKFYFNNVVILGLAAAPIVGTYLTQTNPQLVGKVSPVIARLFSPLVLIMLTVYLVAILYSHKNPYNDRDFLLTFNGLLIGVIAIIFFSVAEASERGSKPQIWILFLLSVLTIIVNGVALSAIVFRISEWGFTPNRSAVLGGNVLILANLLIVTAQLYKALFKEGDIGGVGKAITFYLPVYFGWTVIVTFIFPLIFGFK